MSDEPKRFLQNNIFRLRQFRLDSDLAKAFAKMKREISKGQLFGPEYRVPVRETGMGMVYRPYRFEIVAFGSKFMKERKGESILDKQGRTVPAGVGAWGFTKEVFNKLGYPPVIDTLKKDIDAKKTFMKEQIKLLEEDIQRLQYEAKKSDEEGVRVIDSVEVNIRSLIEHYEQILPKLDEIEKELLSVESGNSEYVKEFMGKLESVAGSNIDWGTGENGEDDKGALNLAQALPSFHDIPDYLHLLIEELEKDVQETIQYEDIAKEEISKAAQEWRRYLEKDVLQAA